ncbi:hypothetical protein [Undibacterium sp. SXout20W]|uniref:hypothetical protein n=1 Tax=Undibacterium sp. SXout20W TaxID=3413051 RepID=UPI003BF082FD
MNINQIAEAYVKLVLATGQHDDSYVDAYIGPAEWRNNVQKQPLAELLVSADELLKNAKALPAAPPSEVERQAFLLLQVDAVRAHLGHLAGHTLAFDDESQVLYDAVSPALTPADLDVTLTELENLLPGGGELNQRLSSYNKQFEIPREKLDAVFTAAINEARARTRKYIVLPENESFQIAYVTDKVWSAYNWYKGNSHSLIEVNTDFPMFISRAIDLASHEAYPGHHVFNVLIENELVKQKGWIEYAIYPLYSPMSFLAEGSANYGIEVAFPHAERMKFEKEILFPLAGIDPDKAERYYQIQAVLQKLSYVGNMVAKQYLDGEINRETAIAMLMKYSLSDADRSAQRIRFIENLRSYVINYNLGQDVVQAYIERRAGTQDQDLRWKVLTDLLRSPKSASMMV